MLHDFLTNNREELAARCRVKVGNRAGRSATEEQLNNGIPIAQRTVASNKGTLTVHNLCGEGCVFTINLPRHAMFA